ncbi:MAG: hypothetical protein JNL32_00500 [Candidatus Kapabacteria bacterium]|nr:hypothetical protein [Candidatus Kapabacteria bacterium]
MYNAKYGAVGSAYRLTVYYTNDSGRSWRTIINRHYDSTQTNRKGFYKAYCLDSTTIYVRGMTDWNTSAPELRFFRTTNTGATWDTLGCTVKGYEGETSNLCWVYDLLFCSTKIGIASAYLMDKQQFAILRTTDGGLSWYVAEILGKEKNAVGLHSIQLLNKDTCFLNLRDGTAMVSTNQGEEWRWLIQQPMIPINQPIPNEIRSVYYTSLQSGVGQDGYGFYTLSPDTITSVEPEVPSRLNIAATVWVSSVSPIPITDRMNVRLYLSESSVRSAVGLRLFSIMGEPVSDFSSALAGFGSGWNTVPVNVSGLPNGVYILQLRDAEQQHSIPVIISR